MSDTTLSTETAADEAHSFDEYNAVKAALKPYIDAAKLGDGTLARSAFFDHAHIVGTIGGTFRNSDVEAFEASISSNGPSPQVEHHIAWIDISGPAAAARVEFIHWAGHRFTDFFVLYKQDGAWKISGKVYNAHAKT
ncbi:nuclear transport factor 2 family protein [uncultured Tateyamaria sp.]|uniref:nuclear transport factor 2 family protein n=1 Tax=uncultured Tateyamaria sp. TaxID=455651 RepID=UPI00262AEB63|nr:nuclear transport factor 2 family protein [uncultured Tateyamaria sp.]